MNLKITTPSMQYREIMDRFLARSSLGFKDEGNARLLDISIKTYSKTPTANRSLVIQRLGGTAQKESVLVSGFGSTRRKRVMKLQDDVLETLAYRIIQKRAKDKFGRYLPQVSAIEKARKMIAAVARSIGFIRSGWIPALRRLNSVVKGARAAYKNEQKGQPKGYARPITSTEALTGEIGNTTKVAADIGAAALERAVDEAAQFMEGIMQREQEKIANEVLSGTIG